MTAELPLSHGKIAIVDVEDAEWLAAWKWSASQPNSQYDTWYALRRDHGRTIYMHRAILRLPAGRVPEVDHRNGNGLDNRRFNLREATRAQNLANTRTRAVSGFRGVSFVKRRGHLPTPWVAQLRTQGANLYLGFHATAESAARAYDAAARIRHGEFATLNFG